MTDLILIDSASGIAMITLNRPESLNALSRALRRMLAEALQQADADSKVKAVILTGAGNRAFSAGLDLHELGDEMKDAGRDEMLDAFEDPARAVAECRKPVIAAINGLALTGGLELMLACDFAIAVDTARFADTHTRLGVTAMWGLSQRLPRAIGAARAKQMSFTGNFIDAQTALSWGLVNRLVPGSDLMAEARALAQDIVSNDAPAVALYKQLINQSMTQGLEQGLSSEQHLSSRFAASRSRDGLDNRQDAVRERGRTQ